MKVTAPQLLVRVHRLIQQLITELVLVCNTMGNCLTIPEISMLKVKNKVVPDTDLAGYAAAGYPANNFYGYRISG